MAAKLFLLPFPTAFTTNGLAEPGAKLEFYATGTSTPLPSYTTSALTTEHPWPVVANGAGRFESVYLDSTLTYRLVIKDADGDTLDEIDPYIPGTLIGQQGSPGGNVMSIGLFTEASGIEVDEGTDLVQTSGYFIVGIGAGRYAFSEAVDAAYVTAHPRSSFISSNGRGFRLAEDHITVDMFGAAGDGTTNDYAAFRGAIDDFGLSGGVLNIPPRRYRIGSTIKLTTGVSLIGAYRGRNPGIVDGVNYPFPTWLLGTVLHFDSGVNGIRLTAHSDDADPTTALNNWEFPGATWAEVKNMSIVSAGGGTTSTHAIEMHTIATLENIYIRNFGGDGVRVTASVNAGHATAVYGNANKSILRHIEVIACGGNGIFITGYDANVVLVDSCDCSANTLAGFRDESLLGCCYINCHVNNNAGGSYICTGTVASSTYIGCYIEQSGSWIPDLGPAVVWVGGNAASPTSQDPDTQAFILGYGISLGRPLKHLNRQGTNEVTFQMGVAGNQQAVCAWGSEDDTPDEASFQLRYGGVTGTANWWGIQYAGTTQMIQFPNALASARAYAPSFPNGLFIGPGGAGPRLFYTTAAPASGAWNRGDIVFNSTPSAGGVPGWVCTAAGSPGTWKAMGVLAA